MKVTSGHLRTAVANALPSTPLALLNRQLASVGGTADGWQRKVLTDPSPYIFALAGRQVGKGSVAAARLVWAAGHSGHGLHLVVSASQRQARVVIERCALMARFLGPSLKVEVTADDVRIGTSRITALPASSDSIRGYTVTGGDNPAVKGVLLLDEACFTPESTWASALPTTSANKAHVLITSSAGAIGHWTHTLFESGDPMWSCYRVRADESERCDPIQLELARGQMAPDVYRAEYESQFRAVVSGDPVFDPALLQQSFSQTAHEPVDDMPEYFDLSDPWGTP